VSEHLVATPVLHPAYPNPFNPVTTISYELPTSTAVDLSVYDVAGKLVKRLVEGEVVGTGRHDVIWDGKNEAGRSVAAGVYLCRLEAGGHSTTQAIALVK
jgi:flagellar hook assembly protein FlgD